METIRRAVVYASKNPKLGDLLLVRLEQRAKTDARPLTKFDYGYAGNVQAGASDLPRAVVGLAGVDGYQLVVSAIRQHSDPAMEFAAAVITQDGRTVPSTARTCRTPRRR
jgi:hypothetical protein